MVLPSHGRLSYTQNSIDVLCHTNDRLNIMSIKIVKGNCGVPSIEMLHRAGSSNLLRISAYVLKYLVQIHISS